MAYSPGSYGPVQYQDPSLAGIYSAMKPQQQSFTPWSGGLYQSGGNYYLPESLLGNLQYNPGGGPLSENDASSGAYAPGYVTPASFSYGTRDYGGVNTNTIPASYLGYNSPLQGNYEQYDNTTGNSTTVRPWESQLQWTTDPATGGRYLNLGSDPSMLNLRSTEKSSLLDALGGPVGAGVIGLGVGAGAIGAAGAGGAAAAGGGAEVAPELLAGPAVDSSAATDAAFGAGGPTAIAEPMGAGTATDTAASAATGAGGGALANTAGTAGAVAGGTALSRMLDGTASTADILSALGGIGATGLGIAGSLDQRNRLNDLADNLMRQGQPYRDLLQNSYSNPGSYLSSPEVTGAVQQGTDALARSLSVQGNPIGSGTALQTLQDYATKQQLDRLAQYRAQLGGFGGLSNLNAAAPGAEASAAGSTGSIFNAVGSGLNNLTNPPPSLQAILARLGGNTALP